MDTQTPDTSTVSEPSEQLKAMLGFLDSDPKNSALLSDCAELALTENQLDMTNSLLQRFEAEVAFTPKEAGMAGLLAMKQGRHEDAVRFYESLQETMTDDPAIEFNLAWSRAHMKNHEAALDTLSETTRLALPQAAMLDVQLRHQLGHLDDAVEKAKKYMEIFPDDRGLMACISVLAMDVDDVDLAKACAEKSGDHPDALTTIGMLALGEEDVDTAAVMFDKALSLNPHAPRSWIGKGLAQLVGEEKKDAAKNLDKGAEMFGTHLGSWIAAGWAYFVIQDYKTARERFEHALQIDDTFAESHGSLAVMDIVEGDMEQAKQRTRTALRLDRECFSAALAQTLVLSSRGDAEAANRIFETAMNTPIDENGKTLSDALIRLGMG